MAYDGTTPLKKAVADLIGCSPKSNNKLAQIVREAKNNLGITSQARKLPPETNLQIYSHLVELYSQTDSNDSVEIVSQADSNDAVEILSQDSNKDDVNILSQHGNNESVNIDSQNDNNDSVNLYSQVGIFDAVRIAFYVTHKGERKRQVIALDGFFINALTSIGISKKDAPQWVQAQVNGWTAFDGQLPNTRQVKYLIMREVVKHHSGSDDCFYNE